MIQTSKENEYQRFFCVILIKYINKETLAKSILLSHSRRNRSTRFDMFDKIKSIHSWVKSWWEPQMIQIAPLYFSLASRTLLSLFSVTLFYSPFYPGLGSSFSLFLRKNRSLDTNLRERENSNSRQCHVYKIVDLFRIQKWS